MAKEINVQISKTINMGNFNSLKVQAGIAADVEEYSDTHDSEEAFKAA